MPSGLLDTGPLYRGIVDSIREQIVQGRLSPGDQIPTIDGLCHTYNVSTITAKRALTDLRALGLVRSVRGKGTFVTGRHDMPQLPEAPKVRRIALMVSGGFPMGLHAGFFSPTCRTIEETARSLGLGFRVQTIPAGGSDFHIDLAFEPDPAEGLIFLTTDYPYRIMHLVHENRLPAVTIDAANAFCHAVLTENLAGMAQMVDHLRSLGHRRLLLAPRHPRSPNPTNENERTAAFRFLVQDRGLTGQVVPADDTDGLLAAVGRRSGPTAIVFTQEQPAYDFIGMASRQGLRVPEGVAVTGFDGWCHAPTPDVDLTTVRVDRTGLGRRAVEFLLELGRQAQPPPAQWVRVNPRLHHGTTAGSIPR